MPPGVQERNPLSPSAIAAKEAPVTPSTSLAGVIASKTSRSSSCGGHRVLNQDAVHGVVVGEGAYQCDRLCRGGGLGELMPAGVQANRSASVGFHAHVGVRGGVISDEHRCKAGSATVRFGELSRASCGVRQDSLGDGSAVDDVGSQSVSSIERSTQAVDASDSASWWCPTCASCVNTIVAMRHLVYRQSGPASSRLADAICCGGGHHAGSRRRSLRRTHPGLRRPRRAEDGCRRWLQHVGRRAARR